MKRNLRIWRGLTTITASLLAVAVGAGTICEGWRENIDQNIGTISSAIETENKTIDGTYTYTSDYSSTDELIQEHKSLNEVLSEEGSVLLKNENKTLPLSKGTEVTLFGSRSHYMSYGGQVGGTVEASQVVTLETALQDRGFQVNPVMIKLYDDMGNIVTGKKADGSDLYGYRPGEIGVNLFTGVATEGYRVGEPPLSLYKETDADYQDSFKEYHDAAIVVIGRPGTEGGDYQAGEKGLAEGESGSTVLALNEEERDMINLACENFDKVIVLVNSVSQMEIEELKQNPEIDSILWVGFPGCYGTYGIADILNGTSNPSGHLASTYAVDSQSSPAMQNYGYIEYTNGDGDSANTYVVEAEGIYVGYKYYETRYADTVMKVGNASSKTGSSTKEEWKYPNEVSYGFGYGMSYTSFEQTLDSVQIDEKNHTVTVTATVKNTGDVAGKDVVQIYVQTPYTEYDKENLVEKSAVQLVDYIKSDILDPGEKQTLTTTFEMKEFASYDYKNAKTYIMDAGDYYLALGNGAHDALNNILAIQGYTVNDGMDAAGNASLGYTWKQENLDTKNYSVSANGTKITNQLDNADMNYWQPDTVTYLSRQDWSGTWPKTYEGIEINDAMQEYITMDFYDVKTGEDTSDIFPEKENNASFFEMKQAEFDDPRWEGLLDQLSLEEAIYGIRVGGSQPKDYPSVDMVVDAFESDGPSGFSYSTLGARSSDSDSATFVKSDDPNADYRLNDMVMESVVASTFNKDLALAEGKLFGNDSLWSNITIFFAPAMNLQRTPYNARNDEYYSEDPILTNQMGKAVISGARTKGCLPVAKHFAFNDQESGRMGVSVFMTEQKARETELKAFEGAVDGGGLSIMTSFNRIGIIYSSAHTGLMQNILRDEWGYKGFLMTDMLISQKANYMTVKESVIGGTTLMGISSDSLAGKNGEWSYFTKDGIQGDATLTQAVRDNTKYLFYALANSNAMNGINETSRVVQKMTWWRAAYLGAGAAMTLLTLMGIVFYIRAYRKNKKEETQV